MDNQQNFQAMSGQEFAQWVYRQQQQLSSLNNREVLTYSLLLLTLVLFVVLGFTVMGPGGFAAAALIAFVITPICVQFFGSKRQSINESIENASKQRDVVESERPALSRELSSPLIIRRSESDQRSIGYQADKGLPSEDESADWQGYHPH